MDRFPALLLAPLLAGMMLAMPARTASRVAQVDVYDRTTGESLPTHRGRGARWIVGERGHEYSVRIRNCSDVRVLAVVSVDGVNAVTGQSAAPSQSGYVIEPGGYVTVEGWRKSLARTAAFVFTDPSRSYAARTNRPDDVGVIGVALFREREPRVTEADSAARQKSAASAAATPAPSLGTGHGRGEYSPAQWTAFERASTTPDEIHALRYESREALIAMGVLPRPRASRDTPDPFPAAPGFVPDP